MFKKIKGFKNYFISKSGVVIKRNVLKQNSRNGKGYVTVTLKGKQRYLHRLLWEAFVGEIPKGYEIDHIDTDPTNNKLENLRLVTHKENCNNKNSLINYSNAFKGREPWIKGKKHRPESIEKMKETLKRYYSNRKLFHT